MGSCLSSESRTSHPGSPSSALVRRKKNSKKKGASETPGRLSANGATESASLYTQQGKKGATRMP